MAPPDKGGTDDVSEAYAKILCQALETQGKDNQKNWLSLCVFFISSHNYDGGGFKFVSGLHSICEGDIGVGCGFARGEVDGDNVFYKNDGQVN